MKIIILEDEKQVGIKAADMVEEVIRNNPKALIGLATGSSPIPTYKELIQRKNSGLDFSSITTVNLDEYIGLGGDHPQSYRYFMNDNLFSGLALELKNTHVPRGDGENPENDAMEYEKFLKNIGKRDIQILGIGVNGHIAFNEPEDPLSLVTHVVNLTEDTIKSNSRFFESMDEVPKRAITMGMGQIFNAKKIILIATGKNKAQVVKEFISPDITTNNPSSFLKLHDDVTVICDKEAGKLIAGDI